LRKYFLLISSVALFLCLVSPLFVGWTSAGETIKWNIKQVDSTNAYHSSITLDSKDYPKISYYGDRNLKYASWNGDLWDIQTIDTDSHNGYSYTSLKLNNQGYPCIRYFDPTRVLLKYAYWNGTAWIKQVVDSNAGCCTSLALDTFGLPHISYSSDGCVKYASLVENRWLIETIDNNTGYSMASNSLVLDHANNPHICYGTERSLICAEKTDGIWVLKSVAGTGQYCSIALNSQNKPCIAYWDGTKGYAKYAKFNGDSWTNEIVDSSADVGTDISLALDSKDQAHICYKQQSVDNLKYAHWNGTSWAVEFLGVKTGGTATGIVIDHNDLPHICFNGEALVRDVGTGLWYASLSKTVTGSSPSPSLTPDPTDDNSTLSPTSTETQPANTSNVDDFTYETNSTSVTPFIFDMQKMELTFNVTGPSRTTGYLNLTVSKSLLANAQNIHVFIDGKEIGYSITSDKNSWFLTFFYTHSTHAIRISFESAKLTSNINLAGWIVALTLVAAVLALVIAISVRKKSRKVSGQK
jgi:hypothetical protein